MTRRRFSACATTLVVASAVLPSPAFADDPPVAGRESPRWPLVTGFLQRLPSEGAPATHQTEVRVAFDATALCVAINAVDPEPDRIAGILTRRDDASPSDWVSIYPSVFGFAASRTIARLNETSTWPLLARSASVEQVPEAAAEHLPHQVLAVDELLGIDNLKSEIADRCR